MLLTGDIERLAEQRFSIKRSESRCHAGPAPRQPYLLDAEFIHAVGAALGDRAAGYRNRFGHPNPEVLERYRGAGTNVSRTDRDGAVTVCSKVRSALAAERARRGRYWLQ